MILNWSKEEEVTFDEDKTENWKKKKTKDTANWKKKKTKDTTICFPNYTTITIMKKWS